MMRHVTIFCSMILVLGCGPYISIEEDVSTLTPRTPRVDQTVWGTWVTQHLDGGQAKTRPYPLLHLVFDATSYDPEMEIRLLPSAERRALMDDRMRQDRLEIMIAPSGDDGLPIDSPFGHRFGTELCRTAAELCTGQVCGDLIRDPCQMDIALVARLAMPLGDELKGTSETATTAAADFRGPLDRWELELSEGGKTEDRWLKGRLALEFADEGGFHHGVLGLRFSVPLLPERIARCNLAQLASSTPIDGWPCDGEGEAIP